MARPIVVEAHGSYESAEAARWAAQLSNHLACTLHATRCWSPGVGQLRESAKAAASNNLRVELAACTRLAYDADVRPLLHVVEGDWPSALIAEAQRVGAAAIVVPAGADGSRASRNCLQDKARDLIVRSTVPVAIVPAAGANRPIRRILVGTPEVASPTTMIDWAVRLASSCNADLHVVSVLPPAPEWEPTSSPHSVWLLERKRRLGRWSPALDAVDITHQVNVLESINPFTAWERESRRIHADIIVLCANTGRGWSASHGANEVVHLARDAGLPVLVVPSESDSSTRE